MLYSNLGYAYFGEKKYEESMASFRIALQKDPQFFEHNIEDRLAAPGSLGDRSRPLLLLARQVVRRGRATSTAHRLSAQSKDEGYEELNNAKTDPAFANMLKNPEIQEILTPKPVESAQR